MRKMNVTSNHWRDAMLMVQRRQISPIHATKTLLHWGHCLTWGGLDTKVLLAMLFYCCCFLMISLILPSSLAITPALIRLYQVAQTWAASSQVSGLISQHIKEIFSVSLYHFCPAWQMLITQMTQLLCPPQLGSPHNCIYAHHICFLQDVHIWNPILLFNVE